MTMDFIAIAGDLWDLLVLTALPFISILMGLIFLMKIFKAAQISTQKWIRRLTKSIGR
jgi:hypothetical protein